MNALLEFLSTWMPVLLRTSIQAALLVGVILTVQWTFGRRLSPAWRHALWGLVVVRLLLIWAPASPLSVYNLAVREVPVVNAPVLVPMPDPAVPEIAEILEAKDLKDERDLKDQKGNGTATSAAPGLEPQGGLGEIVTYWAAASLVWLGVFSGLLLAMAGQSLHFGRQVRRGRIVTDSDTLELLEECRATLRVSPFLALVETDCVRSPALLGCVRPKLLLPCGFLDTLSRDEMRHVFLHELAHVKRGDIWSGWLFNLLLAAHWFNPAIWFARRRFIADREAACDAHVLAALDAAGQRDYGHTVLNLNQRFNASPWAPGMAGISETSSNLKRRITMIKQFRPPTRLAAWSGAGLCVCIGLATLTNAQEVKPKTAQAAESNDGIDTPRKAAEELVRKGRYDDAMELLDRAMKKLDKGSVEGELAYEELAALYEMYRGEVLSLPAFKNATPAEGSDPVSAVPEGLGDIVCVPSDIYGYTATNGGTMIAAQLTNTGAQDVTVDVEFWEGGIDTGVKIGRGGLVVPAGKTATEAIPWVVENGSHTIAVRIDPDNTFAESDEGNNRVENTIEYTNGRFQAWTETYEAQAERRIVEKMRAALSEQFRQTDGDSLESYAELIAEHLEQIEELQKNPLAQIYDFGIESKVNGDPRISALLLDISKRDSELADMRQRYTEGHPEMKSARATLVAQQELVDKLAGEIRADELATLHAQLAEQFKALVAKENVHQSADTTTIPVSASQVRADCANNMKQLGLTFKIFANEIKGEVFPHLSREPGRLMFAWEGDGHALEGDGVLSAEFLSDLSVAGCPGSGPVASPPDDTDFAYLGYLMRNDEDMRRFAEAYENWAAKDDGKGAWFTDDKPRSPDEGIVRVREGIERFLITDINNPAGAALAQSQIPTLIEWPDRHAVAGGEQGGNVLFMDGHVEFMTYPGEWPMTEETIGILCKLAGREPIKKLE